MGKLPTAGFQIKFLSVVLLLLLLLGCGRALPVNAQVPLGAGAAPAAAPAPAPPSQSRQQPAATGDAMAAHLVTLGLAPAWNTLLPSPAQVQAFRNYLQGQLGMAVAVRQFADEDRLHSG